MFAELETITAKPVVFSVYTAAELWTNEHTAKQMLEYHLNDDIDASSRNSAFITRSTDWMIAHFNLEPGKTVADFGCGPGLYAQRLGKSGAAITGVDFSANSIEYAKGQAKAAGLSIDYVVADYLKFETSAKFDLIIMIMCDYCALSPTQRATLLKKFKSALKPGGQVLLDVYSLSAFYGKAETSFVEKNQLCGFWLPNDYYAFVNTFRYDAEKVTLDKYTIVEPHRRRTVYNWLQHYSVEMLTDEFEANGLKVKKILGSVAGDEFDAEAPEFAVVAC
jgi:cyclopropane fatty-acyl-phospholipid synthase-like methyltransferase